jgi:hypothetical protein
MPVRSFSLQKFIPELTTGLILNISESYEDSHSFSGMARELRPQIDPAIEIRGKVFYRKVAKDIAEGSEARLIKDTKGTFERFTAPQYGEGFAITANDLIANPEYGVNWGSILNPGQGSTLQSRVSNASGQCIEDIRRAEDYQMKELLDTCTLQFDNYTTIDFGRDNSNSSVLTTTAKWSIANASTMKPFDDIDTACDQISTRGNAGGEEFIIVMDNPEYGAFINSDQYKADSDIRRNNRYSMLDGISAGMNMNVPKGATYRGTYNSKVGLAHIFTFNDRYTDDSNNTAQWVSTGNVYIISTGNRFVRQPVMTPNMASLMPMSQEMRSLVRTIPQTNGWLIYPEWTKCTMQSLVIGIYRKFLTLPLTPNKTYTLTANS